MKNLLNIGEKITLRNGEIRNIVHPYKKNLKDNDVYLDITMFYNSNLEFTNCNRERKIENDIIKIEHNNKVFI